MRVGNGIRVIDPAKSRSWKGAAQVHMLAARQQDRLAAPLDVPLEVTVVAWFTRPKSLAKKNYVTHRPSRPDADNVLKIVFDAGNGILWTDDALIVRATVEKRYAVSGPAVWVSVVAHEGASPCGATGASNA